MVNVAIRSAISRESTTRIVTADGESIRSLAVPIACGVLVVATTLLYSLGWGEIFGRHAWTTPGDLWGTFHTAQLVSWGDIGDVYALGGGLVSLPGISIVLSPVALVVSHLGLSVSYPYNLAHPTAWLLLGPYEAMVGAIVLLPLDSIARRLGASIRARLVSSIVEGILVWPLVAIWGHPEDSLALAFGLWALLAALDHRWRRCGWFLGFAVVTQPLVLLIVPLVFALAAKPEWLKLLARTVLPSIASVVIPLSQSWHQTTTALLKQPNYPTIDHPTPWMAFAPVLSKAHPAVTKHFGQLRSGSGLHFTLVYLHTVAGETVAAGPGRLIAIAVAIGLAVFVRRRGPSLRTIAWFCAVALGLRCVFESVMDPYYLWPPLAIAFVLLALSDLRRFTLCLVAGGVITVWSYRHVGPWEWWLPVVALLGVILYLAHPKPQMSADGLAKGLSPKPTNL